MSDRSRGGRTGDGSWQPHSRNNKHRQNRRDGGKRNRSSYEGAQRHQAAREEEDEVDDMLVASTFALQSQLTASPGQQQQQQQQQQQKQEKCTGSSRESSSSEDDSSASADSSDEDDDDTGDGENTDRLRKPSTEVEQRAQLAHDENEIMIPEEEDEVHVALINGDKEDNKEKDAEDDDSEVEFLAEALAQMQENEEDCDADEDDGRKGRKKKSTSSATASKTEHEWDSYQTPLVELESKFQLQVSVPAEEEVASQTKRTAPAGRVKYHMMAERTIVVESLVDHSNKAPAPLEEGSLLLLQTLPDTWIPVGKVFEVFGPVSRPLYTIRLPLPPQPSSKTTSSTNKKVPHSRHRNGKMKDDTEKNTRQLQQATADGPEQNSNATASSSSLDDPSKDLGDGSLPINADHQEKATAMDGTMESPVASPPLEKQVAVDAQSEAKEETPSTPVEYYKPCTEMDSPEENEVTDKAGETKKDAARATNSGAETTEKEVDVAATPALKEPEEVVIATRHTVDEESKEKDGEQVIKDKDEVVVPTSPVAEARAEQDLGVGKDTVEKSVEELTRAGTTPATERGEENEQQGLLEDGAKRFDEKETLNEEEKEDPWSAKGRYTKLLQSEPSLVLYYIPEDARVIDTAAVVRASGRGCDASNLYDEEVVNIHEMEFSDDEEERDAKRRGAKRGHGKKGGQNDEQASPGHNKQVRQYVRANHEALTRQLGAGQPNYHPRQAGATTEAFHPLPSHHHHPNGYVPPPTSLGLYPTAHHGHPSQYMYAPGYYPTPPHGATQMSPPAGTATPYNVAAYQYATPGVHPYSVQPPPPPPPPYHHNPAYPGGVWYQQPNSVVPPQTQAQAQPAAEESDTVYYEYS